MLLLHMMKFTLAKLEHPVYGTHTTINNSMLTVPSPPPLFKMTWRSRPWKLESLSHPTLPTYRHSPFLTPCEHMKHRLYRTHKQKI
jgi:hypothetical protein